jgi:hypothetical protein
MAYLKSLDIPLEYSSIMNFPFFCDFLYLLSFKQKHDLLSVKYPLQSPPMIGFRNFQYN